MRLKNDSSSQKLRGAYYTPKVLAEQIIDILYRGRVYEKILEPSCGDGVFIEALLANRHFENSASITAVEIEAPECTVLKKAYKKNMNVEIKQNDFLDFYINNQSSSYDLIVGNPPYIRYQYLTEKQREIQSSILTQNGMKSNKLINAWVCFLVACVRMLSDSGVIAFIVPAEIMQVAYAEDLRKYLELSLSKITLITFKSLVFPDIEQEVVVLIGEKGKEEKGIRIFEMEDLNDFCKIDMKSNGFQKMSHHKEKWTKYFTNPRENDLTRKIEGDERFRKFADCALINVGITTGNNKYFSLDEQTAKKYDLESTCLKLVGRSAQAEGLFFTKEDWKKNIEKGKKAFLLNFKNTPYDEYPEGYKAYIKQGEESDENIGYKCQIRDRWYIVPSVWAPDAFFLRRNNFFPKFVLNCCDAVSTDTMHRVKFYDNIDPRNILLSYYNSVSLAFCELCGRSYGGGVLEILPGETGNIMLPNIDNIDPEKREELLRKIDISLRNSNDIEPLLDIMDKAVLVEEVGLAFDECLEYRKIWKKMQQRRLVRAD